MKHRVFDVLIGVGIGVFITFALTVRAEPIEYTAQNIEIEIAEVAEKTIEEKIRETFPEDPDTAVLIAKCESGLNPNALNTKNKNGTSDGGLMQINSVHDTRLLELGLDKFNVDDNLAFARILYEERGWKPWVCFTKGLIYR